MARPKTIDYRRVTFSFPKHVVEKLEARVAKNGRSKYVAQLIENKIDDYEQQTADLMAWGEAFRKTAKNVSGKTSLEILREIRYGGKY